MSTCSILSSNSWTVGGTTATSIVLLIMGCINGKLTEDDVKYVDGPYNTQSITPVFRLDDVSATKTTTNETDNNNKKNKPSVDVKAELDAVVTSKYEFKKLIGEGSLTRVWMVEDRRTKQPYAVKIASDERGRECVDAEIVIMSRLRHPNVVHFGEVFSTARATYMVMELATGGDLFDRIEAQGSFAEVDAVRVVKMVLEGVKYLHACGITHRDIKLDNLLFYHPGKDSKILIADFALAVRPDRATKEGGLMSSSTPCGTPEYMAPEVLARRCYTCAVDLWSVGVVVYTVLSSTFPFDDDSIAEIGRLVLAGKYSYDAQVWTSVSVCAKNFIDSLLVQDPKRRLTAAQAVRHPWIRCGGLTNDAGRALCSTISSSSSSGTSSSSSSGRSTVRSPAFGSLSSPRRQRRQQRRTQRRQQEALRNDPEWNEFRHKILVSVGAIQA